MSGNNCGTCERKRNNSRGGHCFLYRTAPVGVCYQYFAAGYIDELDLWLGSPVSDKPNEPATPAGFKGTPEAE